MFLGTQEAGPPLLLLLGDEGHWSPGTWKGRPAVTCVECDDSLGGRKIRWRRPLRDFSTSGPEATGDGDRGIAEGRWCWGSAGLQDAGPHEQSDLPLTRTVLTWPRSA